MITAIITVHNNRETVREAIRSVLRQTLPANEIVVVDDGSTDGTEEAVQAECSRLTYIYQQTRGSASARNTGIRVSQGDYLAFLDGDDVWASDKLLHQAPVLWEMPQVGVVFSDYFLSGTSAARRDDRSLRCQSGHVLGALMIRNFVPFSSIVVRRSCFDRVGMFDESLRYSEDWDMLVRLAAHYEFFHVPRRLLGYGMSMNSKSANLAERVIVVRALQERMFTAHALSPRHATLKRVGEAVTACAFFRTSLRFRRYRKAASYVPRLLFALGRSPAAAGYVIQDILAMFRSQLMDLARR